MRTQTTLLTALAIGIAATGAANATVVTNFGENVAPITSSIRDGANIVQSTVNHYWEITYRPLKAGTGGGGRTISTKTTTEPENVANTPSQEQERTLKRTATPTSEDFNAQLANASSTAWKGVNTNINGGMPVQAPPTITNASYVPQDPSSLGMAAPSNNQASAQLQKPCSTCD